MKKIMNGEELRDKILEAVNRMGDTVGTTLGPTGNNVLIDDGERTPFITNDGVTIAKSIESDDEALNTLLEIIKESSLKTNELVGDGTTTTIVLLQNIVYYGIEEIKKGAKPLIVKRELENSLKEILPLLEKRKRMPKEKDFLSIASISSNSYEIGERLTKLFMKTKLKEAIHLEESVSDKTFIEEQNGYMVDINTLSSLYFQKGTNINLSNCYILVLKGYLDNLEQISECMNECIRLKKPLLLITEEVNTSIYQELLSWYLNEKIPIFVVTLDEFSSHRDKVELDLAMLSNSIVKNIEYEKISFKDLGIIKEVSISQNTILFTVDKIDRNYLLALRKELETISDEYEKEFLLNRLAKLENGIITIYVGATTKTEMKERKMRYEDALWALEVSKKGIVPGEGLSLLEVSDLLSNQTIGNKIMKQSLCSPFFKIMENAGKNGDDIIKILRKSNYQKIYQLESNIYEDIHDTMILDPIEVVTTSLKNAISIASMLLTITHLVVNEKKHKEEIL